MYFNVFVLLFNKIKLSIEQLLLISFLFRKADVTYGFRSFLNRQQNFRGQGWASLSAIIAFKPMWRDFGFEECERALSFY